MKTTGSELLSFLRKDNFLLVKKKKKKAVKCHSTKTDESIMGCVIAVLVHRFRGLDVTPI